jgi:hypothetical protein
MMQLIRIVDVGALIARFHRDRPLSTSGPGPPPVARRR